MPALSQTAYRVTILKYQKLQAESVEQYAGMLRPPAI